MPSTAGCIKGEWKAPLTCKGNSARRASGFGRFRGSGNIFAGAADNELSETIIIGDHGIILLTYFRQRSFFDPDHGHHSAGAGQVQAESEGVQKFYGGECATVTIQDLSNLDEVIEVLKLAISKE